MLWNGYSPFYSQKVPSELPFLLSGQEFTPRFYLASGQTRCFAGTDPSPRQVIKRTNSSFLAHRGGCQALSLLFSASWLRKGYVQSKKEWLVLLGAAWETVQIPAGSRAGLGTLSAGLPWHVPGGESSAPAGKGRVGFVLEMSRFSPKKTKTGSSCPEGSAD